MDFISLFLFALPFLCDSQTFTSKDVNVCTAINPCSSSPSLVSANPDCATQFQKSTQEQKGGACLGEICVYEAKDADGCSASNFFGGYAFAINGEYFRFQRGVPATFVIHKAQGIATLNGTVTNQAGSRVFILDLIFSDRSDDLNEPKFELTLNQYTGCSRASGGSHCVDISQFHYYKTFNGTLTEKHTGCTLQLTPFGAGLTQVGPGANNRDLFMGVSASFKADLAGNDTNGYCEPYVTKDLPCGFCSKGAGANCATPSCPLDTLCPLYPTNTNWVSFSETYQGGKSYEVFQCCNCAQPAGTEVADYCGLPPSAWQLHIQLGFTSCELPIPRVCNYGMASIKKQAGTSNEWVGPLAANGLVSSVPIYSVNSTDGWLEAGLLGVTYNGTDLEIMATFDKGFEATSINLEVKDASIAVKGQFIAPLGQVSATQVELFNDQGEQEDAWSVSGLDGRNIKISYTIKSLCYPLF